jgi:hypothetical protein
MANDLPDPNALFLVVLLNQPRDLEIARMLGWYRIPLRSAPKVIAVDYLAFYQTAAFGADRWRIQYIAPVQGYELTTRAELLRDELDHPHARQEYYKVQLGSFITLPHPIQAGNWKRLTFLYTTGEYLMQAKTVNDLVVGSEDRIILWQSLRERANQDQDYRVQEIPVVDLDPTVLAALLGIQPIDESPSDG